MGSTDVSACPPVLKCKRLWHILSDVHLEGCQTAATSHSGDGRRKMCSLFPGTLSGVDLKTGTTWIFRIF